MTQKFVAKAKGHTYLAGLRCTKCNQLRIVQSKGHTCSNCTANETEEFQFTKEEWHMIAHP